MFFVADRLQNSVPPCFRNPDVDSGQPQRKELAVMAHLGFRVQGLRFRVQGLGFRV